ncbi:MAG: helix-turn-helix transcriptional regulator [Fibrobacteres bacterium]|nr:helix-turn-helix transcriptional regulator [Fibrobacterota bacterium]
MDYFSGIEWINFSHNPNMSYWLEKSFPDYYVLNFAYSGTLLFSRDDSPPVKLNGPVAWWTYPGPKFSFGTKNGETWDHYFVGFRGERVKRFLDANLFPKRSTVDYLEITFPETFRRRFSDLIETLQSSVHHDRRSVYLLEGLLLALHEQVKPTSPRDPVVHNINQLMEQIWQDPKREWDFDKVAEEQSLSVSHFRKRFKSLARMSPHQFLLKAKIDHASRDLRNTGESIKAIALNLGFEDIFHFSKLFKKVTGTPPGEYRKLHSIFE